MANLTKRTIDAARPKGAEYVLWDDRLPGFGLRVYPSGRRSFCVQYRAAGRTRRMSLGLHGVLTPAQAREAAQKVLSAAKLGSDPAAERDADRASPTLAEFSERFLADHAEAKTKASTTREYRKLLRLHVLPKLGSRQVAEINRGDAHRLHSAMKNTPFMANRALGLLQNMLTMAEKWGLRPDGSNPCRIVERFPEPKRRRFLSDEEFSRLGRALEKIEAGNPARCYAVAAVRLITLLGTRRAEILTAKWSYIDWERRELRLPDSKTGPKTVSLNAPARQVLQELYDERGDSPWVICGMRPGTHLKDIARPWAEIRDAAKLPGLRLHDLRHSFVSFGARAGISLPMLGAMVGQSQASTTERYSHFDRAPVHAANEAVGARIAAALEGKPEAEVIKLSER